MSRITDGFTARRLFAAGMAAAAFIAVSPAVAFAAPAQTLPAALADPDQKLALAVKYGLGDDFDLLDQADDCDFVVAFWKRVKENSDHLEVSVAAEQAFTTSDEACDQFIVSGGFAAFDRDVERERREAEAKRASDKARSAAASAVDIVAGDDLLNGSDARFAELIWESVKDQRDDAGDAKWPKVKAAAEDARTSVDKQREFIATGLAAAAKQDTDDRIARDKLRTEEEKERDRARAAKQFAANRIGLAVTEQLLALPYRDFIIAVWNHEADGTQVQIAAVAATRSLSEADWKAFIDAGIHQAKDRDIQIALDKKAAEERRLVEEILARADKAGQYNLPQAARKALAGTPSDVATFLYTGQYAVEPDLPDALAGGAFFGRVTGVDGKCLDITNGITKDGTLVGVTGCNGNDAQDVTAPGDGTLRVFGKCLDSGGGPTGAPGDRLVHLWTCNGTGPQKWHQRPNGTIYQPATDRCLDTPGAQVYIHACHREVFQQWKLPTASKAGFGKVTGVADKCIDIANSSYAHGTPVQLYTCNNTSAQQITVPGDKTLRVLGKCIDSGGPLIGTTGQRKVHLYSCNNTPAQKWHHNSDGTLYNEMTKFCLDTPNANNATQLYVHPCNGGTNQRWKLPQAA